jgi:hypothetical protein
MISSINGETLGETLPRALSFALNHFPNGFRIFYILNPTTSFVKDIDGIKYENIFFFTDLRVSIDIYNKFYPDVVLLFSVSEPDKIFTDEEENEEDKKEVIQSLMVMINKAEKVKRSQK